MTDETEYTTPRGFSGYLELVDTYGSRVRVQQSSAAFVARCWVFIEAPKDGPPGSLTSDGSGHLSVSQARRVRDALDAFITDAEQAIKDGIYDPEPEDDDL